MNEGIHINFIIVDDDKLVIMFCSMMIKKNIAGSAVKAFEIPEQGLEYLTSQDFFAQVSSSKNVLLLDINMPSMTGWEFLEHFETLDENSMEGLEVYILSSSVDTRDMERAKSNKYVKDYLVKPLSKEMLQAIATGKV